MLFNKIHFIQKWFVRCDHFDLTLKITIMLQKKTFMVKDVAVDRF